MTGLARTPLNESHAMKLINSLGFLFIGSAMFLLPQIAPNLCPLDSHGLSARATWLHLMGFFQFGIGASFMVRKAGAELAAWLERWPELLIPVETLEPDPIPQAAVRAFPRRAFVEPLAEVIPVDFKPAWSEQGRAA